MPEKLNSDNVWLVKDVEEMKKNMKKLEDQNKDMTEKLDIIIKSLPKSAVTERPKS